MKELLAFSCARILLALVCLTDKEDERSFYYSCLIFVAPQAAFSRFFFCIEILDPF